MKKLTILISVSLLPLVTFAQGSGGSLTNVENLAQSLQRIVNILLPALFTLAVVVFFWGVVRYIFAGEQDKEKAKKTMLWGVIAIFVMASIWGLVKFIGDTFGIQEKKSVPVPGIDRNSTP